MTDHKFNNEFIVPNDLMFGSELGMLELPLEPILTTFAQHLAFQCFFFGIEKAYDKTDRVIDAMCHKRKCAVVLRADDVNKNAFTYALSDMLNISKRQEITHDLSPLETVFLNYEESPSAKTAHKVLEAMMRKDRTFVMCETDDNLPEKIKALTTAEVFLKISADALKIALKNFYGTALTVSDEDIKTMSLLSLPELSFIFKEKYLIEKCMKLVKSAVAEKKAFEAKYNLNYDDVHKKDGGPKLEDLHGLGKAGQWGHDLAADLQDYKNGQIDWKDVDQGILIYGAPGTGKTTFAAALARTCNVNFIATSAAQWQAKGHLGDYLKDMNAVFKRAENSAPCILFIDEFDAVGDRNISHDNQSYDVKAINGLLEKLDGTAGRKGVVVVAATNNFSNIDPAFKRPGRLDRVVEIPLPDEKSREGILRFHLKENLKDYDLSDVVKQSEGMAGAWLEQLVRVAKRTARRERRKLSLNDLLKAFPERKQLSDAVLKRIAFHEAGHAVVALENGNNVLSICVSPTATVDGNASSGGKVAIKYHEDSFAFLTKSECLSVIQENLGGIASEEFFFKETTTGTSSDLRHATLVAAKMHMKFGFFDRLVFSDASSEADIFSLLSMRRDLENEVEKTLRECMTKAKDVIEKRQENVRLLAHTLLKNHELLATDISLLLSKNDTRIMH